MTTGGSRRITRFRLIFVIVAVAVLVGALVFALRDNGSPGTPPAAAPPAPPGSTEPTPAGVRASWVVAENQKPGSPGWVIPAGHDHGIAGFADHVAATSGEQVKLYVSSTAPGFHVEAYRVGYYHGAGARLVWQSGRIAGRVQPPCPVAPGVNMVSCDNWSPSLTVPVTGDFVQGDYLLKLVGDTGEQSFVPLTVWDPASRGTYLLKNDVFTWQAWNPYGGYDFYAGQGPCPHNVYPLCSRARVVSYDRPYGDEQGAGDFQWLEAPLVRFMEEQGLDLSYTTDTVVAEHPETLSAHRVLLSLGHDECWSFPERRAVTTSEQHGMNLAFFGASGMLRHVRGQPSPLGPDREVVDYRDSAADPLNGHGDPHEVTGNTWSAPPANWPESPFVGESYNGFLNPAVYADLTVTDASSWLFAGTGLHDGSVLPGVIGSDVDSLEPPGGHPADVQILAHSTLPAGRAQPGTRSGPVFYSDMTYYSDPASGAGVWDSGTNNWIPALEPSTVETPATAQVVRTMTGNLLRLLGQGPAGSVTPSKGNLGQIYHR